MEREDFKSQLGASAGQDNCLDHACDNFSFQWKHDLFQSKSEHTFTNPTESEIDDHSSTLEKETFRKYSSSESSAEWDNADWTSECSDDLEEYDGQPCFSVNRETKNYETEDWEAELNACEGDPYDTEDLVKPDIDHHIGGLDHQCKVTYAPSLHHAPPLTWKLTNSITEPGQFDDADM